MVQISRNALASVSSTPPAASVAADKESRLQKLNARFVRIVVSLTAFRDEVAGYAVREPEKTKSKEQLTQLLNHVGSVQAGMTEGSKNLDKLSTLKWEPPKPGPRAWKKDEKVAIRARHQERFTKHGAYTVAQIVDLVVVSTHGAAGEMVKLRLASGEVVGIYPAGWLIPAGTKEE